MVFASLPPLPLIKTVSDPTLPGGCVLMRKDADTTDTADTTTTPSFTALFNADKSGGVAGGCASSLVKEAGSESAITKVTVGISLAQDSSINATMTREAKGLYCSENHKNVMKEFDAKTQSPADAEAALSACEAFCSKSKSCTVCSVDQVNIQCVARNMYMYAAMVARNEISNTVT